MWAQKARFNQSKVGAEDKQNVGQSLVRRGRRAAVSKPCQRGCMALLLLMDIGESALAAVNPVGMGSHEDARATSIGRTLPAQTLDLAIGDLVILQDGELDLPVLVLDLLRLCVRLLLALLSTAEQPGKHADGRVIGEAELDQGGVVADDVAAGGGETEVGGGETRVETQGGGVEVGGGCYGGQDGRAGG